MLKSLRLRKRIAKLEHYDQVGLVSMEDVDAYEDERAEVSAEVRLRRRRERDDARYGGEDRAMTSAMRAQSSAAREKRYQARAGAEEDGIQEGPRKRALEHEPEERQVRAAGPNRDCERLLSAAELQTCDSLDLK